MIYIWIATMVEALPKLIFIFTFLVMRNRIWKRSIKGGHTEYTLHCVTLWLLYVGRTGETSEKRLLWLWTKAAMMLDWESSTFGISTAGIVDISHCWNIYGNFSVVNLAVLTDDRWKMAATYCNTIRCHHIAWCCRQTQDVLHPAECQPAALKHITVTVDSKCLHYVTCSGSYSSLFTEG